MPREKCSRVVQAASNSSILGKRTFCYSKNRSQLIFVYSIPDESKALGRDLTAFSFRIRFKMDTMVQDCKPLPQVRGLHSA